MSWQRPTPGQHSPGLAQSLHELCLLHWELGSPGDAVAPADEAVALRRELAAAGTGRHASDLADSLHQLGFLYSGLGRSGEATEPLAEAIALRQGLAEADPGEYALTHAQAQSTTASKSLGPALVTPARRRSGRAALPCAARGDTASTGSRR